MQACIIGRKNFFIFPPPFREILTYHYRFEHGTNRTTIIVLALVERSLLSTKCLDEDSMFTLVLDMLRIPYFKTLGCPPPSV